MIILLFFSILLPFWLDFCISLLFGAVAVRSRSCSLSRFEAALIFFSRQSCFRWDKGTTKAKKKRRTHTQKLRNHGNTLCLDIFFGRTKAKTQKNYCSKKKQQFFHITISRLLKNQLIRVSVNHRKRRFQLTT